MKLSDLKPCACCGGPLIKNGAITWYVIRHSMAMVHPRHGRETLGVAQMTGSLAIGEVLAPAAEKAVVFIADEPTGGGWDELHVCFDCYCSRLGELPGLIEQAARDPEPSKRGGFTTGELLLLVALLGILALAVASTFRGGH